jgi:hypothetical protein
MAERVEIDVLYPYRDGESPEEWTNRVLGHAQEHGTFRQCTIGWHGECSQRREEDPECRCLCHDPEAVYWSVEGHTEGGTVTVLRVEEGKHHWPPVEGEPETMWAWWVLGTSRENGEANAVKKQTRILEEKEEGK